MLHKHTHTVGRLSKTAKQMVVGNAGLVIAYACRLLGRMQPGAVPLFEIGTQIGPLQTAAVLHANSFVVAGL